MAASETIELTEGHTKSIVLRWEVEPVKRRAISAVSFTSGSPIIDTVAPHDIPDGWRCWVEGSGVKWLDVLDTAKIGSAEYHPATVLSTTSINLNDVSASKLKAWASGGFICYNTPATLASHTQRVRLRDRKGGNLLVCTTAGTSGTTKPTGAGTDGTVAWAKGSPALVEKVWVAGTAYSQGDVCDVSVIASSDIADAPLNLITIAPNLTTFTILLTFSAACSVALAGKTAYGDVEDVSSDATPVVTQLASLVVKVEKE